MFRSLQNRLAIADGLLTGQTLTRIAAGIGKHPSTVSREIANRSINGSYLPYRADQFAVADRARPKQSKLVTNQTLRDFASLPVEHILRWVVSPGSKDGAQC